MTPELKALMERVANVIANGCSCDRGCKSEPQFRCGCEDDALAAIRCVAEATREASEGMLDIAESSLPHSAVPIWRAMHAASVLGEAMRDV
jgi:hypothetical protein